MEPEFYKVSEVAKIFGVTPQAIYKWIDEEKVKAIDLNGRKRIPRAEVDEIRKHGLEAKNEPQLAAVV